MIAAPRRGSVLLGAGLCSCALLVGCTGTPSIPVVIETQDQASVAHVSGMALVVLPIAKSCAPSTSSAVPARYQATVGWRVTGVQPAPITVRITSAAGAPFARADSGTGQAMTGTWVTTGLPFYLVNASGVVLARTTAPPSPC